MIFSFFYKNLLFFYITTVESNNTDNPSIEVLSFSSSSLSMVFVLYKIERPSNGVLSSFLGEVPIFF